MCLGPMFITRFCLLSTISHQALWTVLSCVEIIHSKSLVCLHSVAVARRACYTSPSVRLLGLPILD